MRLLSFLVSVLCTSKIFAAGFTIDINPDFKRGDILSTHANNWTIPDGASATTTIDGITLTLKSETKLVGAWWKPGFDYPARMASDGLVSETTITLTLRGLMSGKHSLATVHNSLGDAKLGLHTIRIGEAAVNVEPSHRVKHDTDAARSFLEFEAAGDVVVTISAVGPVVLNGIEIDRQDPAKRADMPSPSNQDFHTIENPMLTWRASLQAVRHRVYLGEQPDQLKRVGETTTSCFDTASLKLTHSRPYYWRVDTILADDVVILGEMWQFMIRRLAFPTAEGYGRFAIGGRGGKVFIVTNLNDTGPGSLREAVEASGPRTVVFQVGGLIELKSKLIIRNPYITIAGQTAPGDGICLKGYTVGCSGVHDVIVRHIRIRVGDVSGTTQDGCGARGSDHVIYDHCSISWSIDEGFSSREAKNLTVQRCIIAEALNIADHKKYQPGKGHSFAASISGGTGSFHHNLLAHCTGRNWSLAGGLDRTGQRLAGRLDIRNNIVYNWQNRTTDGGVRELNFVGNYYLPGPATKTFTLLKPDPGDAERGMRAFMLDNVIDGKSNLNTDNWTGYVGSHESLMKVRAEQPLFAAQVHTHSIHVLMKEILSDVGANRPKLDVVDQRVIGNVRNRNHSFTGSKSLLPGIIDSQKDAGGWPRYESGPVPIDSDNDGLPDEWEAAHGLDPQKLDSSAFASNGYTHLENYLNHLAGEKTSYDPVYRETIRKRVIGILDTAMVNEANLRSQLSTIVERHYHGIFDSHSARDACIRLANGDKHAITIARQRSLTEVLAIHTQFLDDLQMIVKPDVVAAIQDAMTYNVRPNTFRVYCEMLPQLTDVQKAFLERELVRGRDEAIIAGASSEKHEKFRLAKGRIGNYLSQQGYDLKKAQEEWAKKQKGKS